MRRVISALLLMVLAGCAPVAPVAYDPGSPASLRATAQAAAALADRVEANLQATERAYRAQVTQTAQAYQATAQHLALQATRQAVDATATAEAVRLAVQSYQATATIRALAQRAQEEQRAAETERRKQDFQAMLEVVLLALMAVGLVGVLLVFLYRLLDAYVRREETRGAILYSPVGVLVVRRAGMPPVQVEVLRPAPEAGGERALPPSGTDTEPSPDDLDWIPQFAGDRVIGYVRADWRRKPEDPQRRLALRLLRESIRKVGGEAGYIPGWRELEWPAETWSRAVALLRPYVNAVPGRGGGTFLVGEYRTLAELYNALGAGRITLTPSPAPMEAL